MDQLPAFGDISEIRNEHPDLDTTDLPDRTSDVRESVNCVPETSEELNEIGDSVEESMEVESVMIQKDLDSSSAVNAEQKEGENDETIEKQLQEEENAQMFVGAEYDEGENEERFETDNTEQQGDDMEGVEVVEVIEEDDATESDKLVRLPVSKIKKIMRTDPDVTIIAKEALFVTTVLAEHFISLLAQQSYKLAAASKKKTVNLSHVKAAITSSSTLDFLEGMLPQLDN